MTPLEEQLEKLAQLWEKPFFDGSPDETGTLYAQRLRRALLPLEVTDSMVEAGAKAMFGKVPLTATRLANTLARDCLSAALTQPQTEQWHENAEADKAATAADLDPREAFVAGFMFSGEGFNGEYHNMSTIEATLDRRYEELVKPEEPGPYAKAFRERVCPVPEFPGIKNRQEDQA